MMDNPSKEEKAQGESFPFSSFLQTDYIPTRDEVARIKQFIQESEARIKKNEEKIDGINTEIEASGIESIRLQSDIDSACSILYFTDRLPDRLLRKIFYFCLPTERNALLNINAAPLVLTRVCSHWRKVALTTPKLWSSVHIPIILEETDGQEFTRTSPMPVDHAFKRAIGRAEMISQWLQRAGEVPLSISLFVITGGNGFHHHGERNHEPPPEFIDEYIKVIKPLSMGWKSLRLSGRYNTYQDIASLSPADVPLLESLTLDLELGDRVNRLQDLASWLNSGILAAPSLRRLSVSDLQFDLSQTGVNLKVLTHLSIGCTKDRLNRNPSSRLTQVSRFLKDCTALIHLNMHMVPISYPDEITNIFPVHLPSLRHLTLIQHRSMLPLIEKFEAPCLEEVIFESNQVEEGEAVIMKLVSGSKGNLRILRMKTPALGDSAFWDILRQSPKLRTLGLKPYPRLPSPNLQLNDELLDLLASSNCPSLCPLLVEFQCEVENTFTYEGFLDFIKRKQSGLGGSVAKLKKVSIHAISERDPVSGKMHYRRFSTLTNWRPFRDQGIEFREIVFREDFPYYAPRPSATFSASKGWVAEEDDG